MSIPSVETIAANVLPALEREVDEVLADEDAGADAKLQGVLILNGARLILNVARSLERMSERNR